LHPLLPGPLRIPRAAFAGLFFLSLDSVDEKNALWPMDGKLVESNQSVLVSKVCAVICFALNWEKIPAVLSPYCFDIYGNVYTGN